jgi:MoxR-like ATPase
MIMTPFETKVIGEIYNDIKTRKNFVTTIEEITNIYISLQQQKFVILNGQPGIGKTELAIHFAESFLKVLNDSERVEIIFLPIGKDFGRDNLLGYVGLDEKYYTTKFVDKLFLSPSVTDDYTEEKIFFVILDEMNLTDIEDYFSDILSALENKSAIILPNKQEVSLPQNTFFIGTINSFLYEPTRKQLSGGSKRRGNIIPLENPIIDIMQVTDSAQQKAEFRTIVNHLLNQAKNHTTVDFMNESRMTKMEVTSSLDDSFFDLVLELVLCFKNAHHLQLTLGVLQDICEYMILSPFDYQKSLDYQIIQKVIPNLTGDVHSIDPLLKLTQAKYPKSFKLLQRVKEDAKNNMNQLMPTC